VNGAKQTDLFYHRVSNLHERNKDYIRKTYFITIILLVISCGSGCGFIVRGKNFRPFDENTLTQVTPGKTTASEVTKLFGAPSQIVKLPNGNAYVYERSVEKRQDFGWLSLPLVTMIPSMIVSYSLLIRMT
jgi:hypothetical protein